MIRGSTGKRKRLATSVAGASEDRKVKRQDRDGEKPETLAFTLDESMFPPIAVKDAGAKSFSDAKSYSVAVPASSTSDQEDNDELTITGVPSSDDPHANQIQDQLGRFFSVDRLPSRRTFMVLGVVGLGLLAIGLLASSNNIGSDQLARWRSNSADQKPPGVVDGVSSTLPPTFAKPAQKSVPSPRAQTTVPSPITPVTIPRTPASDIDTPSRMRQAATQVDANDEEVEMLMSLAREHRQLGEIDKAEQIYHRLVRENRQAAGAAFALGGLYLEQEKFAEAYKMYELSKRLYGEATGTPKTP